MKVEKSERGYIPALDGLRALAIIMVLFAHGIDDVPSQLTAFASAGWCGVDLFFVLSGFLITGGLLKTKSATNYFRSFYIRRVLRIFPVFYLALGLTFGVLPHFLASPPLPPKHDYPFYWLYLNNWVSLLQVPNTQFVGHFWSLAVEEQFYMVWPAVVLWLSRRQLYVLASVGVFGAPILRGLLLLGHLQIETVYRNTFCRIDPLMIGALCSLVVSNPKAYAWVQKHATKLLVAGVFFWLPSIVLLHEGYGTRKMIIFGLSINAFCFGAVVLGCVAGSAAANWLTIKALRLIGMWSYGIYIYHLAFVHFCHMIPWLHQGIVRFFVESVVAISVAALSYYFFEQPILRYKKHFPPVWAAQRSMAERI